LPFPVHIVSTGNIRDSLPDASRGGRWASIPEFTRTIRRGAPITVFMTGSGAGCPFGIGR